MFRCFSKKIIPKSFRIIHRIAEGSTHPIYKVKEKKTGTYYTCKILTNNYRTQREIAVLKKLRGSKLQTFYKICKKKNKTYLLTNYIEGKDLYEEYCNPYKSLHPRIHTNILLEMATCIQQIHDNNFVHLDIKFENFIVYKNPYHLILIDFETCHPLQTGVTELQMVVGTKGYIAPEIFKGFYHQNSDIWSFGVCLWALVTGHWPFSHTYSVELDEIYAFPQESHTKYKHLFSNTQWKVLNGTFRQCPEDRMSISDIKTTLQINT